MSATKSAAAARRHFVLAARGSMYTREQHDRHALFQAVLGRVFSSRSARRWRVHGGLALFARLPGIAPSPSDMDFAYRGKEDIEESVADLANALREGRDTDPFDIAVRYDDVVRSQTSEIVTVPIEARLPGRKALTVTADIGTMAPALQRAERLSLAFAPAGTHRRVVGLFLPVAGEIAQRTCAMIGWRARPGGPVLPSARHKTLVGLYPLLRYLPSSANDVSEWLFETARDRDLPLPSRLTVTDLAAWEAGYEAVRVASRPAAMYPRFNWTLEYANEFFTPIVDGTATGVWRGHEHQWRGDDPRETFSRRVYVNLPYARGMWARSVETKRPIGRLTLPQHP